MTASIRILTAASLDSNPSLLIVSPNGSKTLVNCGEGCQRSFLESASTAGDGVGILKASSVNRVCLTHLGHDSLGGLPGMILTTADAADAVAKEMKMGRSKGGGETAGGGAEGSNGNRHRGNDGGRPPPNARGGPRKRDQSLVSNGAEGMPDLEVVGPEGTKAFLHSLRHFMRRDRFNVHAHEGNYDSAQNDNKASAGFTAKKKAKKRKYKGSSSNDEIGFSVASTPISYDTYTYPDNYDEGDDSVQSPPITKQAVSYLFSTPPIPGKFLIERAQALNVPKGPMYGQLKAGKSVTFVDPTTNEERTVTPDEVVAKSSPGVGVAVVYCPTLQVLRELEANESFRKLERSSRGNDVGAEDRVELDVMVHLTPESIFLDPAYQAWCAKFGTTVEHITLNAVDTLAGRAAVVENSPFFSGICGGIRRSFVHDGLFPMPQLSFPSDEGGPKNSDSGEKKLSTIRGCPMMDYVLMPRSRRGLNKSTAKSLYSTNVVDDLRNHVTKSGATVQASSIVSSHATPQNSSDLNGSGEGELIFTGTGSAIPCKHRNVTGKYLRMNNGNSMLLDVGEGTVGQLLQSWKSTLQPTQIPIDEYRSRLRGIKAVWISHPHADHHLGLLRLLSERAAICGRSDPIVLMAPHDMFDFLAEYRTVVPEIHQSYIAVDCKAMLHGRVNPLGQKLHDDLGITYCASIPVAHCLRSYAVVIDGTSFGRVAYSGDCRPSNRFADVAYGADLLIHEATFEDGMEEDAVLKRHSTVGEAVDIASKMNAKSLVLTHFSQRYPKIPQLGKASEQEKAKEIPIAFAFDFMKLTPGTIGLAAELTPALRLLYPQEGVDEEEVSSEVVPVKELMAIPGVFAVKGVL